ncbi:hypothetical protein DXG01_013986 [Tephrocybe rancida]|nr:hypothetical protein DXG01_013986 [Tephrocybe rancida]
MYRIFGTPPILAYFSTKLPLICAALIVVGSLWSDRKLGVAIVVGQYPYPRPEHKAHLFFGGIYTALHIFILATVLLSSRSVWDFQSGYPKDMPQHTAYTSSTFDVHPKEEPRAITFDSPTLIRLQDDDLYPSTSAPAPANEIVSLRPYSPPQDPTQSSSPPSSRASGSEPLEEEKESEPAPKRERSASVESNKSEEKVEKRKRSRVTPDQLQHLERFFLLDRSPTAARRREISDLLGMQERQTQIWFQNRRAKAKLLDGRQQHRRVTIEVPPPESPPRLSTGNQADLHNLIHEDGAVTIIPCTDLTIGSWRRIATTVAKHDLVAYVSDTKRCLTWFIHSVGFGFKMEIPYETIVETKFSNAAPGSGLASFLLSEPPLFYLENVVPSSADGAPDRHWKRCSDWTEGQQASRVLRHDLIGSAPQLSHLLRNLHTQAPKEVCLHAPSYRSDPPISSVTPMELPPPPMANLTGSVFRYQPHDAVESPTPQYSSCTEKRSSFTGSVVTPSSPESPYSNDNDRPPPYSAPSTVPASFAQQQPNSHQYHRQSSSTAFGVDGGSAYTTYSPVDIHHAATHHGQSVDSFSEIPISHGLAPRPYSAQSTSRPFYTEASQRVMHSYQALADTRTRRVSTPSSVTSAHSAASHEHHLPQHLNPQHQQQFILQHSPSPPLLTTPYHPPPHLLNRLGHTDHIGSVPSPLNATYSGVDGYDHYHA